MMQPHYWSPPESHVPALPVMYYDPAYAPYVFPQSPPPFQPPYAERPFQLHPQAPPFVPKLPRLTVPEPPRVDPLAQALRRTMPKIRRPERRSSEGMDDSSISDKFIHVEGVPRTASADVLKAAFDRCGPLRGIFVRLQAERGVVILAFYDSRHASKALSQMQEAPQQYFEDCSIAARIPSYVELNQILNGSCILAESDSRVYITLVGQTTSVGPHMQSLLATFGDLKLFRVVGMHYKTFHVEFFDARDSANAILSLNNHKIHGAVAHLSSQPNSNVVPRAPSTADETDLANRLQATEISPKPEQGAYIEGLPIPFPSSGGSDEPTTPSSLGLFDRTRPGRRASTGSAFPSPTYTLSSSTNQSSDNLPAEGVPFPGTGQTFADDDVTLRRRRSVAHSFDSASASSAASLSFKQLGMFPFSSPDRTASTAPSTPAGLGRKMSLPPFQGPLPPPATNQWTPATPETQWSPEPNHAQWTEDEPQDDGFITVRRNGGGGLGGGAAHMCLPASARAVLDLLRDPPPERNRVDVARIEAGLDTRTTIMLKNIPNKMSAKNLIDFIDAVTPRAIDFLYLRFDFQNECNVGYAFVNFIHVSDLLKFMKARLGRKWNMYASEKVLGAGYANYQGKEALVEKFKNSSIMDTRPAWRPRIFYSSGENVGLPEQFPAGNSMRRARRSLAAGGLYTQMHNPRNQQDDDNPSFPSRPARS